MLINQRNTQYVSDRLWSFLANSARYDHDLEQVRKVVLLNLIVIAGAFFLILLGSVAFYQQNYLLAFVDYTSVLGLITLFVYLKRTANYQKAASIGTLMIGVFYYFLFTDGGVGQSAYVWIYTYPLISIFLLGGKSGSKYALSLWLAIMLSSIFIRYLPFVTHYPIDLLLRIFPSYLSVYIFCLFMEKARCRVQEKYLATISQLNVTQKQLEEKSLRDPLTGVYNRAYFEQFMLDSYYQAKRADRTMALIIIDIDHFKAYNDTYGHVGGDHILKSFVSLLQQKIRRETDHLFRYGGEEFAVIQPSSNVTYCTEFINAVIDELNQLKIEHKGCELGYLTASFGFYLYPTLDHQVDDALDMVKFADSALYKAKQSGRNQYCIYQAGLEGEALNKF